MERMKQEMMYEYMTITGTSNRHQGIGSWVTKGDRYSTKYDNVTI